MLRKRKWMNGSTENLNGRDFCCGWWWNNTIRQWRNINKNYSRQGHPCWEKGGGTAAAGGEGNWLLGLLVLPSEGEEDAAQDKGTPAGKRGAALLRLVVKEIGCWVCRCCFSVAVGSLPREKKTLLMGEGDAATQGKGLCGWSVGSVTEREDGGSVLCCLCF